MAVPRAGRPGSGAWQWTRSARTQRALLDAARDVFTRQGFAEASIADVIERAGSSNGSLYHHFGSKSRLFLALWNEHQQALEEAASSAVAAAKESNVGDPAGHMGAGVRAYLNASWHRRDLAVLFSADDGPPGFEVMKRCRAQQWIRQNNASPPPDTSLDRVYWAVLAAQIGEGTRAVAAARTRAEATRVIEAVIEYLGRVMASGPARR
jgi:AcrR family transcriptional regulator